MTVRARIQAGMAWLDEHFPDHVVRFNPDTLDIGDGQYCVLAQASGLDYGEAIDEHPELRETDFAGYRADERYGFLIMDGYMIDLYERSWCDAYAERKTALIK